MKRYLKVSYMKKSNRIVDIETYLIFSLMIFWDIIEKHCANAQFLFLFFIFAISIINEKKISINPLFFIVMGMVFLHSIICKILGYGSISLGIKQILAISLCYITFENVVRKQSIGIIWKVYYESAFVVSIVGFIIQFCNLLNGSFYYRMRSVFNEPSFLCYFLAPIVSSIIIKKLSSNNNYFRDRIGLRNTKSFLIVLAYLSTFSTIAFLGLVIMIIIGWMKRGISKTSIVIPLVIIILALGVYSFVPDIQMRINDTFSISKTEDVYSKNLSSYTLYNNFQVTKKTLDHTHYLGCGIGSYQIMFDEYSLNKDGLFPPEYSLNREDANSMMLRIVAEFGIVGAVIVFVWLKKYLIWEKSKLGVYSQSILVLLFLFLLRQGNYVHCCSILFVCLYMKAWKENGINRHFCKGDFL